jgi:glyoxylase-like metal-dependent hydrolase (beta-lactamase superfamily II)
MNLEDHIGDIIRKSRQMTNVSEAAAAKAAGLALEELLALEDSGKIIKRPNFKALAPLIDLHPDKLERIANGWLPRPPDLSIFRELRWISTEGDGMTVHCYLVWDEVTREAALFDTGFDPSRVFKLIDDDRLLLKHLFITHTHADHIASMGAVQTKFPKMRLHTNAKSAPPQHRNRPNDFIQLGSLRITNRDTPGHAEDGVTYVIGTWPEDAPHVAIVGDAIFAGSMGGAKQFGALAKQKVREQILTLPPDTLICPGHGPLTTVGQEKENNPFFP